MITANLNDVIAEMDAMVGRIHENAPFLEAVGQRETERVQERIRDSKIDPMGERWAPWAPATLWERQHKGNEALGLLFDEGDLLLSIHPEVRALVDTVEIGSNLPYAKDLQDGTYRMPAREYLGWEPDSVPEYEAMFAKFIETGVV